MSADDFGIYVHVPFCAARCSYCAFVTYTDKDHLHDAYVDAVLGELDQVRVAAALPQSTSVFFGGGTPSRLDVTHIARLVTECDLAQGAEVTVEINPEDATEDYLGGLVAAGVTRFSVGIQSTQDHVLADLGRVHRGDDVAALCQRIASSGVSSWSLDLIVGSVAEQENDLLATLGDVLDQETPPPHVSCYLLTVEKGTPLSREPQRHPNDEVLAARYELVDDTLAAHGYGWYEVSNWSLPGQECRHNQLYWNQGDYLGLGVAAHSHLGGVRRWNIANLETYLSRRATGESVVAGSELVAGDSKAFERLALSLRTRRGVPVGSFEGEEFLDEFLDHVEDRLVLTRRGRLMADELVRRLKVDAGVSQPGSSGQVAFEGT